MGTIHERLRRATLGGRAAYLAARLHTEIVELLLEELRSRGISQENFAALVGCGPRAFRKFLEGKTVTLETVARFFAVLERMPNVSLVPMFPDAEDE